MPIEVTPTPDGALGFVLFGVPGTQWALQSASTLDPAAPWTTVDTIEFIDAVEFTEQSVGAQARFFRLHRQE